jgi:signal transduction histidine kinase
MSSNGPIPPFEIPFQHPEGHEMFIEIRPARITGTDGTLKGFQGVAADITGRKRTEKALRQANRQLNLLSSVTRHDVLNNISIILGFLALTSTNVDDPQMAGYLKEIESATKAIRSQIEFTRVYQDLGTHEPQWIELDSVILHLLVPATVTLDVDPGGYQVYADPMFEKVFQNLLDNSIRHGEHVTSIQVSHYKTGGELVIVWEDNGTGIPAPVKEKIFERGFGDNTGFGLFLIREILMMTGMAIRENGEPGKGARFEITVPQGGYLAKEEGEPGDR